MKNRFLEVQLIVLMLMTVICLGLLAHWVNLHTERIQKMEKQIEQLEKIIEEKK